MLVELKILEPSRKGQSWFVNPKYVTNVLPSSTGGSWVSVASGMSGEDANYTQSFQCDGTPAEIAAKLTAAEAPHA